MATATGLASCLWLIRSATSPTSPLDHNPPKFGQLLSVLLGKPEHATQTPQGVSQSEVGVLEGEVYPEAINFPCLFPYILSVAHTASFLAHLRGAADYAFHHRSHDVLFLRYDCSLAA